MNCERTSFDLSKIVEAWIQAEVSKEENLSELANDAMVLKDQQTSVRNDKATWPIDGN